MSARTVQDWLAAIGMERYAEAFAENEIDVKLLRDLARICHQGL